ncbi:hypothetical protein HK405_000701, partial [Cladochytrium tenue]
PVGGPMVPVCCFVVLSSVAIHGGTVAFFNMSLARTQTYQAWAGPAAAAGLPLGSAGGGRVGVMSFLRLPSTSTGGGGGSSLRGVAAVATAAAAMGPDDGGDGPEDRRQRRRRRGSALAWAMAGRERLLGRGVAAAGPAAGEAGRPSIRVLLPHLVGPDAAAAAAAGPDIGMVRGSREVERPRRWGPGGGGKAEPEAGDDFEYGYDEDGGAGKAGGDGEAGADVTVLVVAANDGGGAAPLAEARSAAALDVEGGSSAGVAVAAGQPGQEEETRRRRRRQAVGDSQRTLEDDDHADDDDDAAGGAQQRGT